MCSPRRAASVRSSSKLLGAAPGRWECAAEVSRPRGLRERPTRSGPLSTSAVAARAAAAHASGATARWASKASAWHTKRHLSKPLRISPSASSKPRAAWSEPSARAPVADDQPPGDQDDNIGSCCLSNSLTLASAASRCGTMPVGIVVKSALDSPARSPGAEAGGLARAPTTSDSAAAKRATAGSSATHAPQLISSSNKTCNSRAS
mmetsp:Transcript_54847/g.158663  ORF Transcript_54847/g.158663 Transcript_54847/m.158663 type:complete len:206 (+) Transcript_54847:151-768(+)